MPANDPWSWTAEELIAALCYSNALFQAAGYAENAPDPEALETQLRSQQVTGHKFLTVLDRRRLVLDNDLKIAHLSQRIALLAVIELLRHRSFTYKQRATTAGVGSLNINSADLSPSDGPSGSFTVDDAGRKRRRVTDLSTVPLSNVPHKLPETPIASVAAASWQASGDADEFAHLLKWQNAADDDDVMDLVGEEDLDDDEYYSPGDAAEEDPRDLPEDDHERPGGASTRAKLSNDEIAEIVNDRIEFYVNSWQPNKGVARGEEIHYEPVRMWEEAEASGKRQELVHKYETDYEYYSQRLHRLFEEIVMWGGSSADVRRQCGNLEITVHSMELAGWLRDIYKLEPVEDSEESDHEDDSVPHDEPRSHPNNAIYRQRPSMEIVDLGSPSESSDIEEGDASPFDHPAGNTTQMAGDRFDVPIRISTPDSIIVDNIEPAVYDLPSQPATERPVPVRAPVNHGDQPENASITTVRRWRWADLVEHHDRKRVVSKALLELRTEDRELIRSRIKHVGKVSLIKEIGACVDMLCRGESKLPGVLLRDMRKVITFTTLFLSFWFCRNCSQQPGTEVSMQDLEELKEFLDDGSAETGTFYDYVYTIMETTFSPDALQHPERPSQAEIIEISDDDD